MSLLVEITICSVSVCVSIVVGSDSDVRVRCIGSEGVAREVHLDVRRDIWHVWNVTSSGHVVHDVL